MFAVVVAVPLGGDSCSRKAVLYVEIVMPARSPGVVLLLRTTWHIALKVAFNKSTLLFNPGVCCAAVCATGAQLCRLCASQLCSSHKPGNDVTAVRLESFLIMTAKCFLLKGSTALKLHGVSIRGCNHHRFLGEKAFASLIFSC